MTSPRSISDFEYLDAAASANQNIETGIEALQPLQRCG